MVDTHIGKLKRTNNVAANSQIRLHLYNSEPSEFAKGFVAENSIGFPAVIGITKCGKIVSIPEYKKNE